MLRQKTKSFSSRRSRPNCVCMMKTMTNTQTVERINAHTDRRNQPGSFDPVGFTVVPPRRFEDLRVGDVFRAPSRTLTDEIPQ
jgi:hypothetical protein